MFEKRLLSKRISLLFSFIVSESLLYYFVSLLPAQLQYSLSLAQVLECSAGSLESQSVHAAPGCVRPSERGWGKWQGAVCPLPMCAHLFGERQKKLWWLIHWNEESNISLSVAMLLFQSSDHKHCTDSKVRITSHTLHYRQSGRDRGRQVMRNRDRKHWYWLTRSWISSLMVGFRFVLRGTFNHFTKGLMVKP